MPRAVISRLRRIPTRIVLAAMQGHSITYRNALGKHQGGKAFIVQTVSERSDERPGEAVARLTRDRARGHSLCAGDPAPRRHDAPGVRAVGLCVTAGGVGAVAARRAAAVSCDAASGGLTMMAFGLGTLLAMLSLSVAATRVAHSGSLARARQRHRGVRSLDGGRADRGAHRGAAASSSSSDADGHRRPQPAGKSGNRPFVGEVTAFTRIHAAESAARSHVYACFSSPPPTRE